MTELNIPKILAKEKAWTDKDSALKTYQHIRDSIKYSATELSTEGYVLMAFIDNLYEAAYEEGYNKAEKDYEEINC